MNKTLPEMTLNELQEYKIKWQKKRTGFQVGSKNFRKANRRVKRANIQIELKEKERQ